MPDIIVNVKTDDYIVTDAIIDPVSKDNVETYILKDNNAISFSFANHEIVSTGAKLSNFYYRTYRNKNLIIRSRELAYLPATDLSAVHEETYDVLKATNRINDCLFKYVLNYVVLSGGKQVPKEAVFYFKIVDSIQYDAYKNVDKNVAETEESGVIKRPKKQK